MEGSDERRQGLAHAVVIRSDNAARLREIAAIATNDSLSVSDRLESMRTQILEGCAPLDVKDLVPQHELDKLMRALKQLLELPDFDVVYGTITDAILRLIDQKLEQLASCAQPQVADPLSPLRHHVRHLIIRLRHEERSVQVTCDMIGMTIGWQCGLLGLPLTALPDMTSVLDNVHDVLTDVEAQHSLVS